MLKLIAFALIPFALVAGNATAAKGGPSPGVSVGWDGTVDASSAVRYVALPAAKTTTVAAVRTSDGRVLRYATIRGAYGIPFVAFDGTAEGISNDGKTLVLADLGANASSDALRRPQHRDAPAQEGAHASRPLGLRRPFAERPDALRDPVPRHRSERALQRPLGQPRHRQAGRRRDHRPARAGRGDERLAVRAHAERERRLGVHALREAERDRVRPRTRHRQAARVLRRPAVAHELRAPRCGAALARERRPLARAGEAAAGTGSQSSTPPPSR